MDGSRSPCSSTSAINKRESCCSAYYRSSAGCNHSNSSIYERTHCCCHCCSYRSTNYTATGCDDCSTDDSNACCDDSNTAYDATGNAKCTER